MSDMRLGTGLHTNIEQRLRLAPQIIQSIEILQLSALALEELVLQEMTENPVLEVRQDDPSEAAPAPEPAEEEDPIQREMAEDWREFFGERPRKPDTEASDRKQEAMNNTAARPETLHEYLLAQFRLLDTTPAVRVAAFDIIFNIDSAGYLRAYVETADQQMDDPLEALAAGAGGAYTPDDAREALRLVQGLDPRGVGARDLRECLLLQLPPVADELVREIIERHLEDLEQNRLPKVAQKTGRSIEDVKDAIEFISRLNPRPGAAFGAESAPGIAPDVVVEYTDAGYEVRLEDDRVPNLFISSLYEKLASSPDAAEETRKFLRDKIRAARWLIDAIEQRRTTLYRIACAMVDLQKEFLDFGLSHLKPLRMQEVADKVGVHVSTVSRAIAGKYIQTPRGIFAMKYFFTGGVANETGEVQTWRTIQQEIREVVDKENKSNPLSDEDIADILSKKGSPVARRTVTKYRKALGIPSSRRRRAY